MVAIVSGNSLGLNLTSHATLGQQGAGEAAVHGRNGQAVFVNVASGNLVLQQQDEMLVSRGLDAAALRTYDAQGHLRDVADARVHVAMDYDRVGNRTRVATYVNFQGTGGETSASTSRFFKYDGMNRQVVVDAVDAAFNLGTQGHAITYDKAGNRTSDTYWGNKVAASGGSAVITGYDEDGVAIYGSQPTSYARTSGMVKETYRYDTLNRLQSVERDGLQIDVRHYDGADRVVQSGPAGALPVQFAQLLNEGLAPGQTNGNETRINRYDANGRLLHQKILKSDNTSKLDLRWDPSEAMTVSGATYTPDGHDAAGNALGYVMENHEAGQVTEFTTTQALYDGYREATTTGVRAGSQGASTQHYDVNGMLVAFTDSTQGANNRTYVNDANGVALFVNQGGNVQRQLVVNGEVLGIYGAAPDTTTYGSNPNFANLVDFDFGYSRITAQYPNASPGAYQVRAGDTLQSIAQSSYGDGALWYRIAEANGLASSKDLKVGQTLNIPNRVSTISNNAGTFKPYDPSRINGDFTPNMPMPANDKGGCGGIGKLLMVVVAVVATIYTAGAMAGAVGTVNIATGSAAAAAGAGSTTATFAAGASVLSGGAVAGVTVTAGSALSLGAVAAVSASVGAAVGSVASQMVGMAAGVIDKFDWKGVGLSALSAGITSGVSSYFASSGGALSGSTTGATAARAAISNLATQGVGVAVGLQKKFDWRGVAASAVGAAVADGTAALTGKVLAPGGFGQRLATGLMAGAAAAVVRGGRVIVQQVAVDAFGNALGSSLADSMNPSDPLGDFINERVVAQERRDLYGLGGIGARLGPSSGNGVAGWSLRVDQGIAYAASQPNAPVISPEELTRRKLEVEDQVRLDILGHEARDASLNGAQLLMTGGPARNAPRGGMGTGSFEVVRNGNWDAALNIGADPIGLLGELPGLKAQLNQLTRSQIEKRIEGMRAMMLERNVKNVPGDYVQSLVPGSDGTARTVRDYGATLNELHTVYEGYVRDQRLRETWGDDYQSLRFGKSQMTAPELEKKVLDVHLKTMDSAYAQGVELIAKGELEVKNGEYARTLGTFADKQIRDVLRGMARAEGINDSSVSNIWAINRRIKNDLGDLIGYPDSRLGFNLHIDSSLAKKNAFTEQIMRWNEIRPGNFLIIRPTQFGGAYVIPRNTIPPLPRPVYRGM